MKILAIETSCDDTGIAILEANNNGDFSVLSNIISSQIKIHRKYGGVFPAMAKREHQKNLPKVLKKSLKEAKISEKDVDLIAITNGPGLEPCLWTGVNFAKELSKKWEITIIPVNHIESHILVNFLHRKEIKFPAIALIVSGGHTQIILVKKIGDYKILGETRDDAAGECFDKAAKILGLSYPGGPEIAKFAKEVKRRPTSNICSTSDVVTTLPRPMINTKDYDFSFSGLKTAILYHHQKQNKSTQKNKQYIADMAAEIQQAIIDVLIKKTMQAAKDFNAKTIILGGGVSANHELKTQFLIKIHQELPETEFLFPQIDHSTDNGLMTAITAYFHRTKKIGWEKLQADANLRISD